MKSKTLIEKQAQKKTNNKLVRTIIAMKKNKAWLNLASQLSGPSQKRMVINLDELDKAVQEGDKIAIPGKILSKGNITKKINITAFNFSEKAKEKLKTAGCKTSELIDEIKKNPEAKEIKFLKTKNENN